MQRKVEVYRQNSNAQRLCDSDMTRSCCGVQPGRTRWQDMGLHPLNQIYFLCFTNLAIYHVALNKKTSQLAMRRIISMPFIGRLLLVAQLLNTKILQFHVKYNEKLGTFQLEGLLKLSKHKPIRLLVFPIRSATVPFC